MKPYYEDARRAIRLYHGECRKVLESLALAPGSVAGAVTDPPYSSGGLMRSDRNRAGVDKYVLNGTELERPDYSGDNRDQRSYLAWAALWLAEIHGVAERGAPLYMFTDWRQLPVNSDAIQAGGWIWRGIIPWDKTEAARPQKGWFRAQCEYVLTATNGTMGLEQDRAGTCSPGIWREYVGGGKKHHVVGKPLGLMMELVGKARPGGLVVDLFAGGGTTLVAAARMGYPVIGIEIEEAHCEVTAKRLTGEEATAMGGMFKPELAAA